METILSILIVCILGGIVFYVLLPFATHPGAKAHFKHWWAMATRYGTQQGGYVHDTGMTQFIPPTMMYGTVAAWAMAAGQVSGSLVYGCDATDEVAHCFIPIPLPSNNANDLSGQACKGSLLKSIEIDFEILTAALDAGSAVIRKYKRGADGAVVVVSTPSFTYDSGHDSAAERVDVDQHKMTLTLDTPVYIENDEYYWVDLVLDKAATSTVEVLGAFANFTTRI